MASAHLGAHQVHVAELEAGAGVDRHGGQQPFALLIAGRCAGQVGARQAAGAELVEHRAGQHAVVDPQRPQRAPRPPAGEVGVVLGYFSDPRCSAMAAVARSEPSDRCRAARRPQRVVAGRRLGHDAGTSRHQGRDGRQVVRRRAVVATGDREVGGRPEQRQRFEPHVAGCRQAPAARRSSAGRRPGSGAAAAACSNPRWASVGRPRRYSAWATSRPARPSAGRARRRAPANTRPMPPARRRPSLVQRGAPGRRRSPARRPGRARAARGGTSPGVGCVTSRSSPAAPSRSSVYLGGSSPGPGSGCRHDRWSRPPGGCGRPAGPAHRPPPRGVSTGRGRRRRRVNGAQTRPCATEPARRRRADRRSTRWRSGANGGDRRRAARR